MPRAVRLLVAALIMTVLFSADRQAPSYSAASIVNAASNQAGSFAPNTFVTIYGSNLAFTTRSLSDSDIHGNSLPTILPGTGVTISINHIPAQILYVSPTQINVLIPSNTYPGPAPLLVTLDNLNGPVVLIDIQPSAPALFQVDLATPIAVHADGKLISPASPAKAGEIIVLYATGLGGTVPQAPYGEIPQTAALLKNITAFKVLLNGNPLDPARIYYAGVAPGFAGLYQVNLALPDDIEPNPEIRIQTAEISSKAGLLLPTIQPATSQ